MAGKFKFIIEDNTFIDQKRAPSCIFYALWNLLEIQKGVKITQEEVDKFYELYIEETGRLTANIYQLIEFSRKHPLLGEWVPKVNIPFNENVPSKNHLNLNTVMTSIFKNKGVLVVVKVQKGDSLPVIGNNLIHANKGFTDVTHAMLLYGYKLPYWFIENSWLSKPNMLIHTNDLRNIASAIYEITF